MFCLFIVIHCCQSEWKLNRLNGLNLCRWHFTSPVHGQRPGINHPITITGWEDAKASIHTALTEHAPVYGLLGFSQGATAAALYASDCSVEASLTPPQCIMCISGFMPRDPVLVRRIEANQINVPALHIVGAKDEIIPQDRSKQLAGVCACGERGLLEHPGGHFVPSCSGDIKQQVLAFLESVAGDEMKCNNVKTVVSAL
jgi:hypothetical protein